MSQIPEDVVYESFAEIDASDLERELINTSDKDILGTELFVVKKTVDTSLWEQGNYAIKAVVRNMGSEPTVQVKTYFKDSTPPPQPTLTVSDPHSGGTVNLEWTGGGADVAYYKVLRTENPEAEPDNCELIASPVSPFYTDTGLTDGTVYYYYVVTVDNAGNNGEASKRQSVIPTAVSDLGVYSVYASPATLAAGRTNTIRASLRNNGNAAVDGVVKFYYGDLEIGSAMIQLAASTSGEVSIEWDTPADLPVRVDIKAVVTTVQETDATDENNSFTASDIKVNIPPVAKIVLPALSDGESYNSGESLNFSASGSADPDGSIVQYRWDFGNGKKGDYATSSVTYTMPGRYTVTLTVTDDCGVKTEASQVITVGDRRPDLFVESVRWSPSDPKEGDMVTITATIGNKGLGDATLGFLTGFYIDNRYMGYSKTDVGENGVSLACGKTTEVSFSYQSSAGTHIVKVVANDILNNLSETSKANNVKSEVLSSQQLSFADVAVTNIYWNPEGTVFDTQAPFVYRADISNIGTAEASNFSVSLYIDDEFSGRQTVPVLAPGASTTLSFNAVPQIGIHKVEVKADDLNPCLIEADIENNTYSIVTDEFSVYYPELEITEVTWKPTETTLTDGTSLLFTAKLTNLSTVSVTDSFRVSFTMDGRIFRTVTVEGIGAGEVKEVQAKWAAASGNHQLSIIVDSQHGVIDPDTDIRKDIDLPRLSIIYPNVCVSNVSYSPIKVEAGKPVSFLAYITNNNVASAFKRFNVGLYVDGKAVGGASVDGIRGFSTVPVVISWTPEVGGVHNVKIVADSYGELKMDAPSEGTSRTWSSVINVSEALVMNTHPNEKDQDEDFLAVLYSTSEEKITLTADLRHSSNLGIPVTPEDDGEVYYSLSLGGEVVGDRSGKMRYDYANGIYTIDVPLGNDLATGTYQLDFIGRSGADTVFAPTTNIKIVREGNVTVETNKESYQLGESIHVSGTFRYSDGTPVAGERVVLDYRLLPALKEPIIGVDANGKEILMKYQAEESLRQGETASSVIRLTNIGTAPITGVSASVDLPFISLQNVDSEAVIMPVNRGYSIRDPKGSLSIVAVASPSDHSLTGVYDGKITITSPSLSAPVIVPVKISVGAGQVGTTVFEVRNQDNTLLSGAKVTLIGLDEQLDPVRFDVLTGDGDKAPLGEATFENIPAGNYTLKVSADSHSALETAVSVAAVIDRTPRIVKLSRQLFTFSVDEDTISEMRNSSAATPNYNNVVFKAGELACNAEPQLMDVFGRGLRP